MVNASWWLAMGVCGLVCGLIGCEERVGSGATSDGAAGVAAVAAEGTSTLSGQIAPDLCMDLNAVNAAEGAALELASVVLLSNDGTYRLTIEPRQGVIPRNEYFGFFVTVEGVDHVYEDVASINGLYVSGAMPHHEHGMNVQPLVVLSEEQPSDGGVRYLAHGFLLHMPGRWELYFDIREDGVTERAQFSFDLP